MPIYEYACGDCGRGFEYMHLSAESYSQVRCPACQGGNVGKKMSSFAVASAGASFTPQCERTGACDTPNLPGCGSGACGL